MKNLRLNCLLAFSFCFLNFLTTVAQDVVDTTYFYMCEEELEEGFIGCLKLEPHQIVDWGSDSSRISKIPLSSVSKISLSASEVFLEEYHISNCHCVRFLESGIYHTSITESTKDTQFVEVLKVIQVSNTLIDSLLRKRGFIGFDVGITDTLTNTANANDRLKLKLEMELLGSIDMNSIMPARSIKNNLLSKSCLDFKEFLSIFENTPNVTFIQLLINETDSTKGRVYFGSRN